jgi:transcription initiation factor IIE alpha subunit
LNELGIVKSLTSPKRYFTKNGYEHSNEHKLVEALNKHHMSYSDRELAERFGFSFEQVRELRKRLGKAKRAGWNFRKNRKNLSLVGFLQQ